MSALEEYNSARVGMPTSIQTVVNQRKADAAINELLAEVEHQTKARKRHAKLEREAVLAYGKMSKRAEDAEAEVERLKGELKRTLDMLSQEATSLTYVMTHSKDTRNEIVQRAEAAEVKVLQLGIEKDAEEYRANVAEAERDRLAWMLVRSVCDECLVHKSGACSEEEGEDCPPVRDALADLAARYDAQSDD